MRFFPTALMVLIVISTYSQPKVNKMALQIDTIKSIRIKIDGGGSFYSYDSIDIGTHQLIFAISAKKIGFICIKGKHDYIYLKRIKVENDIGLYRIETYSTNGQKVILRTKETGRRIIYPNIIRTGTLTLRGKINQIIKVHGVVDEGALN